MRTKITPFPALIHTVGLISQCFGVPTVSGDGPYLSGYSGYVIIDGQNLTLTLSSNSDTISIVNPMYSTCNDKAYRSAAIKQFGNIITIVALLFIAVIKSVF